MTQEPGFVEQCRDCLDRRWAKIRRRFEQGDDQDVLGDECTELKQYVLDCLTSSIKSYHYVLPTQLLAKLVDSSLDARSLQVASGFDGAFDARTVAHSVIVPFDRANSRVLGGSPEPYVNNPLRCPAVIADYRDQQKNKTDWDKLSRILQMVEDRADESFTSALFDQVLVDIYRLLSNVTIVYPTPNRISLDDTQRLVSDYLATPSGGERIEAVCAALFRSVGEEFALFDNVRRGKTSAADAALRMSADIECYSGGRVTLLVEVKDRSLTLTQLDSKLDLARAGKISEILFIAEQGKETSQETAIDDRIRQEFASGQNVYVTDLHSFSLAVLVLLGEAGRVDFLRRVGEELDLAGSAISHRRAWADMLRGT